MAEAICVRGVEIGVGLPKICVSIMARDEEAILEHAGRVAESHADMVEWRADYYEAVTDSGRLVETLAAIRDKIGDMPLVFTARTEMEGGIKRSFLTAAHHEANMAAIESGVPDIVDVEFLSGKQVGHRLIDAAKDRGVVTMVSSSDYMATPPKADVLLRLHMMQAMGADIPRFAAAVKTPQDLLNLLDAICEFTQRHCEGPVVATGLGSIGNLSRVAGKYFGSAIAFGFLEGYTPPGQLNDRQLRTVLDILHTH